ncbi:ferritin-like domain-containing protein [Micromonospora zhanjiangensis]|uniref:Ferritin-like domain-containing protein n=1 Tax=Micromonospora zhanjiangensis TaxID=1522057 RepID=A0ABV8KGK8_9ACTN
MTARRGDTAHERLAAAFAAENAASYAYGLIGVRLTGTAARDARDAEASHRARRDALVDPLTAGGATPPPAAPAYALPFPVTDPAGALRLAVEIEQRTAAVWRAALPGTTGDQRTAALNGLIDCAVRATRWRRAAGATPVTVPFPGTPG